MTLSFCSFILLLLIPLIFSSSTNSIDYFTTTQTGQGTYYGNGDQGGACGLWPLPAFANSLTRVALNHNQYLSGNVSQGCGMCFTMYGTGAGLGATPIVGPIYGFVNNICPECDTGSIDVGVSGDGRWDIYWKATDCPVGNTFLQYLFQGSNVWYLKVQVRNHRVPVYLLEIQDSKGVFHPGSRTSDNFWNAPSFPYPLSFPLTVKVTSITGDYVIDTISSFGDNTNVVNGGNNVQLPSISASTTTSTTPDTTTPDTTTPDTTTPDTTTPDTTTPDTTTPDTTTPDTTTPDTTTPDTTSTTPDTTTPDITTPDTTTPDTTSTTPDTTTPDTTTPDTTTPDTTTPDTTSTTPDTSSTTPDTTTPDTTSTTPVCSITGCTVGNQKVEFVVPAGVTVSLSQIQCNGVATLQDCTAEGSNKYLCSVQGCNNPIPYVNGNPCPITLGSVSQTCGVSPNTNPWWVEYFPPTTDTTLTSVQCSGSRYYPCNNVYDSKVGCAIGDSECTNPVPIYNNSPCPFPSSIIEDSSASSTGSNSLPLSAFIGIGIVCGIIVLLFVILMAFKKNQRKEEEEIV